MNSRVALVVDPDANTAAFHLTKISEPGSKILKGNFELSSHRRCDVQHATLVENVRHREKGRRDSQTVGDIPDRAMERSLELGTEEKFASAIFRARLSWGGAGKG